MRMVRHWRDDNVGRLKWTGVLLPWANALAMGRRFSMYDRADRRADNPPPDGRWVHAPADCAVPPGRG